MYTFGQYFGSTVSRSARSLVIKVSINIGNMLFKKQEVDYTNKIKSVLFGVAVGDALGVPVEFKTRQNIRKNPVTDMIGFGTYHLQLTVKVTVLSSCAFADIVNVRVRSKRSFFIFILNYF